MGSNICTHGTQQKSPREAGILFVWRARRDSNPRPWLRRPVLYPAELRAQTHFKLSAAIAIYGNPASPDILSERSPE